MTRSSSIAVITLVFLGSALGLPRTQSEGSPIEISVKQLPSPLLEAANQVSEKLQVPVGYEEPKWAAESDLMRYVDTPDIRARSPEVISRVDPKEKVAGAGTLEARAVLQPGADHFQLAGQLLRDCLESHVKNGNPGRFKLVTLDNYGYSIVPTEVLAKSGKWVKANSPLDVRISFPRKKRYLGPTLEQIADAVLKSSGQKLDVDIYNLPGINTIFDVAVSDSGADNEVARVVLARTFREMKVPDSPTLMMSWHLMRRIRPERGYAAYALRPTNFIHTREDGRTETVYWPEDNNSK